jgi:hypothetical protein
MRANKGVIDDILKRLDDAVMKTDVQKMLDEQTRVLATVTVFKSQMKLFERKIMEKRESKMIKQHSLLQEDNIEKTFAHPDALQPGREGENPSSTSVNLKAVSNMKQNLTSMINRVDLLTDTKIGEVKKILKNILDNLGKLNKRVER